MNKIIPYGKQYIDDEDINNVIQVLKSDWLTQGPKIAEFENKVADYHNCKYAVAFSNGTAALHASYYVSNIKKDDNFITSPITFAASANGGIYCGATPKFVDIDPVNYCIDISKLEDTITRNTKVITPVSYAGYPVDLKSIKQIADKHNITIIHDAAHAIGAKREGKGIVDFADMTILSFHPVKHVTTGEGGMVLTNNEEYYKKLILFRNHGITKDSVSLEKNNGPWYYEMQELGYNYRITDIQCALGISQIKKLDSSLLRRNEIANKYMEMLKGVQWLTLPKVNINKDSLHSYHLFPVLVNDGIDRKDFFEYMRNKNIWVQVHYIPVHLMPYYKRNFGFKEGDFPVAENFYSREVSLPMFPTLTNDEFEYVIDTIKKYKK